MKDTLPVRVRFGTFELDLKSGELWEDGRKIVLTEQVFQVLRILVEYGGEVASREVIQKKLWPNDTIVEFDHSINAAINKLRRVLGDSAEEPKYIETVARRGYRLMMPVEWLDSSAGDIPPIREESDSEGGVVPEPELEPASLTGKIVSHYRVLEIIGGGGMGLVYKAEDLKLGRQVALKFLPEELARDPASLQRFEREARTASSLNHPNICTIYEVEEHEDQPFIVMELLEGQTLRACLASGDLRGTGPATQVATDRLLDIARQILEGLEAAHEKGIIHRDIKPANIFLTGKGVVKILDFGLAKLLHPTGERIGAIEETRDDVEPPRSQARDGANLTRFGVAVGTAAYMSPEQVRGDALDARTDLFSFGVVLYEMATGRRAFGGETEAVVHAAIAKRTPVPLRELNATLPPELERVINKALEKNRELRYPSAAAMRADLETVKRGLGLEAPTHPPPVPPDPRRSKLWQLTAVILVCVGLITGVYWWYRHKPAPLTERDSIVLADFTNTTGDALFDDGLKRALAYQLGQSPLLNVLSDQKVSETLKLMNLPPNARLTQEMAQGVCQRTNSKALVAGSIEAVGEDYLIQLRAVNCQTGETLANTQAEAENRSHPLKAMEKAANQLRGKLGESLASVQKFNKPLEEATTASLEALRAYSQGEKLQVEQGDAVAELYFKRALELDPNFALAYAALAVVYDNRDQTNLALENYKKAYELRDRVSQKERLSIEALYYLGIGDLEKAISTYKELIQIYPQYGRAHTNLGVSYRLLGEYDKSVDETRESIRLVGDNVTDYNNLALDYNAMTRPDQAKAAFDQARSRKLDDPHLHLFRYDAAFLQGDDAVMQQEAEWAMGKRGAEDLLLSAQSDTEAYYGRFGKARYLSQRAVQSAKHADTLETAAGWRADEALREAEIGNISQARQAAADAISLEPGRDVRAVVALTLARIGDSAKAQKLVDQLNQEFPLDTIMQGYSLPTIRAAIDLQKNNPDKAIEELQAVAPYEMGGESFLWFYPAYVRGEAYLKAGQGRQAAAEFQRVLDHPGIMLNFVTGALVRLQMARAQALSGDKESARKSYQAFLELWKNADPDLHILQTAQAEHEMLK